MWSPRLWWSVALAAVVGVHVAAVASIVLPALPAGRCYPRLIQALPVARHVLLAVGSFASVAIVVLLVRRRSHVIRGGAGIAGIVALLVAGNQYGHAETTHVTARPTPVRVEAGRQVFDHAQLDAVLARFVDEQGMVDYRALAADRGGLDEYVGQLAGASPRSAPELFPTEADRTAYWINAYNALILRAIIDHYPVGSVKDVMAAHGIFSRLYFPVGGHKLTLDDIEKGILLKEVHDPRVHFALTCASMSCPRLDRRAFHAADLSERLDHEGRDLLRSPDGIEIDGARGVVRLSSYFEWYRSDFGDDPLAFVRPYLDDAQRAALDRLEAPAIEYLPYDWRLNDAGASWRAR